MHTFNPSAQEAEAGESVEFEASLVYRVSSRKARAAQDEPLTPQSELLNFCLLPCLLLAAMLLTMMDSYTPETIHQNKPFLM